MCKGISLNQKTPENANLTASSREKQDAIALPVLIIVAGLPATGKTTLARRLAERFSLPLVTKDAIKETLCDVLECASVAQSRRLGQASMLLLYQFAETLLGSGLNCIVESPFYPAYAHPDFQRLQQRSPYYPLQIYCHADVEVMLERMKQRIASGARHPGHMDQARMPTSTAELPSQWRMEPLEIGGELIMLDTTCFDAIAYEELYQRVKRVLDR